MSKDATSTKPLIIFVGAGFDGLEHMSARLQQFGVETAWIGYPYEPRRVVRARMFTNYAASAKSATELERIIRRLGPARVADIICGEDSLAEVNAVAHRVGLPDRLVRDMERRVWVADKFAMSELFRANGVPVPGALDADDHTVAEAVEQLGLPLVVKSKLGYSGRGVRIVDTALQAQAAVDELREWSGGGVFFEQMVSGSAEDWAAAYRDGEVLLEACYRTIRSGRNELGAADTVQATRSDQMSAAGRRAIRLIGGSGLTNIDFMRGPDGTCYAIDVNLRPWHSTVAFLNLGLDFARAYLATLGLEELTPQREYRDGETFRIFPRSDSDLFLAEPFSAARGLARDARRYVGWTNRGYIVASAFRVVGIVGANLTQLVKDRRAR